MSTTIRTLERKLCGLRRNIEGIRAEADNITENDEHWIIFAYAARVAQALLDWQRYQELWEELDTAHFEDDPQTTFPDPASLKIYEDLRNEVYSASGASKALCAQQERRQDVTTRVEPVVNPAPLAPRLPHIELPVFHGDLFQWIQWRDSFNHLIGSNTQLPPVSKLHYLRNALGDEPATLLAGLAYDSEGSFERAWEALLKTYECPRVLASRHIQNIVNFTPKQQCSEVVRHQDFLTQVANSIEAFRALPLEDHADSVLAILALRALDADTRKRFETAQERGAFPSSGNVVEFVRQRLMAAKLSSELASTSATTARASAPRGKPTPRPSFGRNHAPVLHISTPRPKTPPHRSPPRRGNRGSGRNSPPRNQSLRRAAPLGSRPHSPKQEDKSPCGFCNGKHHLARCFAFSELPPQGRSDFVRAWVGCYNCLSHDHRVAKCRSKWTCRYCGLKHHSLVHTNGTKTTATAGPSEVPSSSLLGHFHGTSASPTDFPTEPIMGSAQVFLDGPSGSIPARVVLDSGSHRTVITTASAKRLGARIQPYDSKVTGLGVCTLSGIKGWTTFRLRSTINESHFQVRALVMDRVTLPSPSSPIPASAVALLSHHCLADPTFGEPSEVDVLLGLNLYPKIINGPPRATAVPELYLMSTVLGDVVLGAGTEDDFTCHASLLVQDEAAVNHQLQRFWELEEPAPADRRPPLDVACEEHFMRSHSRTPEGRFIVRMPLKPSAETPDPNREIALKRFYSLERKLGRDPILKSEYQAFMKEYLELGHMEPAREPAPYIIPHHGVWKVTPGKTKLRVVFDASNSAGSSSLNDTLLTGPKLQTDLRCVLMQFRLYPIALTADLVKMYRQVLIHPADRHMQHILWRAEPSDPIVEYELCTVTYGVASSAYQALRVVRQLSEERREDFPLASDRALKAMYVDDIVSGANTLQEANLLKAELVGMFHTAGFELGKWASNAPGLLSDSTPPGTLELPHGDDTIKILGLVWDPRTDMFSFHAIKPPAVASKRALLSAIARVFDPLGFLSPVIFRAKTILREVWRHDLGWDESLPSSLANDWFDFIQEWPHLRDIHIPRYIKAHGAELQLIGFADASSKGYSAVVYARAKNLDAGSPSVTLLTAKTKVAPNKFLTISQLELCGALLLARTMQSISLDTQCDNLYFTDSSVVLAWLRTPIHHLKVFEANRVNGILGDSSIGQWSFVPSEHNPADVASRGCLPSELGSHHLWWSGPEWLAHDPISFPATPSSAGRTAEVSASLLVQKTPDPAAPEDAWMHRLSDLTLVVRVVARLLRWLKRESREQLNPSITGAEFSHALLRCVYVVQRANLPAALYGTAVPPAYRQLQPFVDQHGLVRVGGRLRHADLPLDQTHPLLLPKKAHLTQLIIHDIHTSQFHAGPSLTLALLRNRFWVPGALKLIRSIIYRCVHCRRHKAKPAVPLMGDLPPERFQRFRAFSQVGVDYAGPFTLKESNRRKAALGNAYVALFVCLSTKAIHLELVSSLSAPAFLATLDRFVARRGIPQCIHSDNATNFVGASRTLKDLFQFIKRHEPAWVNHLAHKSIDWKFIPPRSPHFGGLWEAGVKSMKSLLVNAVGRQPLTFEELSTILARIESMLNSRPLCPLREDPDDFDVLTPGHFLIGAPLSSIPDRPHDDPAATPHTRWRLLQQQVSLIWNRWSRDYLHHLQQRTKWTKKQPNLSIGDLVIMTEDRLPIGGWPVARVCEVTPGKDGTVRVVRVRTSDGKIFKRATARLVPLFPLEETLLPDQTTPGPSGLSIS